MQLLPMRQLAGPPRGACARSGAIASSSSSRCVVSTRSRRSPAARAAAGTLRSEEAPKQQQQSPPPAAGAREGSAVKRSGGGGGKPDPSSEEDPEQPPPRGPSLPPQLRQLLALLTEFGGKYGTAAVLVAYFTHVDPFGGLHWDAAAVQLGLLTFLPLIAFDAVLMLPDYTIDDPNEQRAVTGMFLGASAVESSQLLRGGSPGAKQEPGSGDSSSNTSSSSSAGDREQQEEQQPSAAEPRQPGSSSSSSAAAAPAPPAPVGPLLRARVVLGLLQQVYTRANPGIGLSPPAEAAVVVVATLADEMLYRAVGLTLLGLWLRDRLFEAGFDDDVALTWLTSPAGEALSLPTSEAARYLAVGVIALLGMAGFAAGAFREVQALRQMQVLDKDGNAAGPAAESIKTQLVASLGSQNIMLYAVEGLREVTASVMAGVAFVATGNLAAPLAGSIVVQSLFSLYQRISLQRAQTKRRALADKMRARNKKMQAAMAAALAAQKAQAAAAPAAAVAEPAVTQQAQDEEQQGQQQPEQEVDFLTAVLAAAEEQQARAAAAAKQPAPTSSSSSTPGAPSSSVATATTTSSGEAAAAPADAAAAAEAATAQLSLLLEDMLRSPEGSRVVQDWMAKGGGGSSPSSSSSADEEALDASSSNGSSSSNGGGDGVRETVERLLSDPATKARLLAELQGQLVALSEASAARAAKIEDSWRSKL